MVPWCHQTHSSGDLEQLQGFRQLIGTLSESILSSHRFSINKQRFCTYSGYCTCWGYVRDDAKMVVSQDAAAATEMSISLSVAAQVNDLCMD